ncbi:McrB family protein [Vibrio agarivorans]|uniref:McrB family protein n=1 Tax=Vibrio agarivorans TaxID=153622 RepID=UPI0025B2F8C6|nr:AAA family ATPase [Vibrio agarivorans]MDN3663370.1 AAA family ATPase [Vibrio agarivorans]
MKNLINSNADVKLTFHINELVDLTDDQLLEKLKSSWGFEGQPISVWGRLRRGDGMIEYQLDSIHHAVTNERLEYPLSARFPLQNGVFVHASAGRYYHDGTNNNFIKAELDLSPKREREKHENPFELNVVSKSIELLEDLPIDRSELAELEEGIQGLVFGSPEHTMISRSVYLKEVERLQSEFAENKKQHKSELSSIKRIFDDVNSQLSKSRKQKEAFDSESEALVVEISAQQKELDEMKSLQDQVENEHQRATAELRIKFERLEQEMSKKIERLKQFVEEKAGFLKDFEFIDEDVYADLSGKRPTLESSENGLSFSKDFDSDYSNLTSYLQAYLKEQGQYYSRHIVENYLTLLRTNDLIILAGDSGSGKTSLVQSFAEAVGGIAKIIPVKPNWTSSEDLLGYYNPLEKKYLATPFLEALLEANQNPETPYFICLDEMNLARVEYYFADFLSKLEERKQQPEIQLYSDDEAAHVLSELRGVVSIISGAKEKHNKNGIVDFVALMQDEEVNAEIKRAFGFSDKDSLIKYHGDVRRMLAGVIGIPSTITIPKNVRIVGAINIDETTHYLSPKILDRAHIMKFKSPLLTDWTAIEQEIENYNLEDVSKPVRLSIDELGVREAYPNFTPADEFCRLFTDFNREHFHPLGVEFGMRTIRQGLNYLVLFKEVNPDNQLALNNFLLHKVLPKFTFDGSKPIGDLDKLTHIERVFLAQVEDKLLELTVADEFSALQAIRDIAEAAKANDDVVNYWA